MIQKVCVFCSSSSDIEAVYFEAAVHLGRAIAISGKTLIYGGCDGGLMGVLAKSALDHQGKVIGVIPRILYDKGYGVPGLSELIVTESLTERKSKMESMSDAFVVLPGGFGTLDEAAEVLALKQLKILHQPVIFINVNQFFDSFLRFLDSLFDKKFVNEKYKSLYRVVDHVSQIPGILDGMQ